VLAASVSVRLSRRFEAFFAAFWAAENWGERKKVLRLPLYARPKSEKCLERAEKAYGCAVHTETLAT